MLRLDSRKDVEKATAKIIRKIVGLKTQSIITLVYYNDDDQLDNIAYDITETGEIGYALYHKPKFYNDMETLLLNGRGVLTVRAFTDEKIDDLPIKNISVYRIVDGTNFEPVSVSEMIQAYSVNSETNEILPYEASENYVYDILELDEKH